MGKKTAMQEFKEWLNLGYTLTDRIHVANMADIFIEKEKKQIENAYNQGCTDTSNERNGNPKKHHHSIQYFTQTYNQ